MTSGGLGTMGYGLPAAIGVQLAHPKSLVIDIAGEASILMNIQEMSTAMQYRLPVKIFILNNQYMGMVRQWQELLHGGRYSESYTDSLPDFVKLAEAYGAHGIRCSDPADLDAAIKEMIDTPKAGDLRLRGRPEGELLPDDPVGQGAQRDDPGRARGRRRRRARQRHRREGQDAGVTSLSRFAGEAVGARRRRSPHPALRATFSRKREKGRARATSRSRRLDVHARRPPRRARRRATTLRPTPAIAWPLLAERLGAEVVVKHENHLPTGAFKVRGGLTYCDALRRREPAIEGIVSATRGNHGQSLAFAGRRFGLAVTIVVPHGNSRREERRHARARRRTDRARRGLPGGARGGDAARGARAACTRSRRSTAISCAASRPTRSSFSASVPTSTCSMCRSARARESAAASPRATRWA